MRMQSAGLEPEPTSEINLLAEICRVLVLPQFRPTLRVLPSHWVTFPSILSILSFPLPWPPGLDCHPSPIHRPLTSLSHFPPKSPPSVPQPVSAHGRTFPPGDFARPLARSPAPERVWATTRSIPIPIANHRPSDPGALPVFIYSFALLCFCIPLLALPATSVVCLSCLACHCLSRLSPSPLSAAAVTRHRHSINASRNAQQSTQFPFFGHLYPPPA
jgi:hypothetical protein